MNLHEIGEFEFIRQIQKRFSHPKQAIPLGIGDDAAAVTCSPRTYSLLTTDTLIEEVHFSRAFSSLEQVGYKSITVNLSDIAAMGGLPHFFLISLGLTSDLDLADLNRLYRGITKASKEAGIDCIGGNTAHSKSSFFITITLLGEVSKNEIVRRSGANVGDAIFVTGTVGDAAAGLELLKKDINPKTYRNLIRRHQTPKARWAEGRCLAKEGICSSMIDISDGLAGDLGHLITQSGVGAALKLDQLPLSPALKRYAAQTKIDPVDYALYGGEDYELLFTVPEAKVKRLMRLIKTGLIHATEIGTIIHKKKGLVVSEIDGTMRKINSKGYDHFKESKHI